MEMLQNIGNLIRLTDIDSSTCFIGGLSAQNGEDGKFAYCWQDNLTQVVFHVATLMPTRERDPKCNDKIRHIGNDHVCITYNDSGISCPSITGKSIIGGQLIKACIVITPLEYHVNKVEIQADQQVLKIMGHNEPFMISDQFLPLYVRQIAIHANLASQVQPRAGQSADGSSPYVSNWVERLKQLKRIGVKAKECALGTSHPFNSSQEHVGHGAQGRSRSNTIHAGSTMSSSNSSTMSTMSSSEHDFNNEDKVLPDDFTLYA
jgi:tuberous sclerosis protein 2